MSASILTGEKILGSQDAPGNINLAAGSPTITGILPVANGGTGTTNGGVATGSSLIFAGKTITAAGTTGARTINQAAGSVNFAAAATSLVVTNSLVTANSLVIPFIQTNDATLESVRAVPAAGSFTIFGNAAATAETRVGFLVIN